MKLISWNMNQRAENWAVLADLMREYDVVLARHRTTVANLEAAHRHVEQRPKTSTSLEDEKLAVWARDGGTCATTFPRTLRPQ